jgi:hypothetical protein
VLSSCEKDSESKAEKTVNQEKTGEQDLCFSLEPDGFTGSLGLVRTYCQIFYVADDNNKFLHNFANHLPHCTVSLNKMPTFYIFTASTAALPPGKSAVTKSRSELGIYRHSNPRQSSL